jgi:hypothetical protein
MMLSATPGNISGTPFVEQLSVPSNFFGCLQYPEIFVPLWKTLFQNEPKVIQSQIRGIWRGVPFQ